MNWKSWRPTVLVAVAAVVCLLSLGRSAKAGPVIDLELANSQGMQVIGAHLLHDQGNWGSGIKIGIIDSGIDYSHPELSDVYAGGWDFVNNDSDPIDDYGHGTEVAGIIGAARNGQGLVGVAPEASLYAYKVFNRFGVGNYTNIIAALDRAIADGMDVVNLSFGSPGDPGPALLDACNRVADAGIILVASAGNSGEGPDSTILYPARYSSVIAVGATTLTDERADFSSVGPELELVAPGVDLYTTTLFGDYTTVAMGTSLSAPYVTGAAALLIHDGVPDVRDRLLSMAVDLGPSGFDPFYGYGRVNVAATTVPVPSAVAMVLMSLPLAMGTRGRRVEDWLSSCRRC